MYQPVNQAWVINPQGEMSVFTGFSSLEDGEYVLCEDSGFGFSFKKLIKKGRKVLKKSMKTLTHPQRWVKGAQRVSAYALTGGYSEQIKRRKKKYRARTKQKMKTMKQAGKTSEEIRAYQLKRRGVLTHRRRTFQRGTKVGVAVGAAALIGPGAIMGALQSAGSAVSGVVGGAGALLPQVAPLVGGQLTGEGPGDQGPPGGAMKPGIYPPPSGGFSMGLPLVLGGSVFALFLFLR